MTVHAKMPRSANSRPAPRLWTSWRDRRNEKVVTVVRVLHWGQRFGVSPPGGHGFVYVEVDGARYDRIQCVEERDWPNFELIYDPHTGEDLLPLSPDGEA